MELRKTSPGRFRFLQPPLTMMSGAALGFLVTLTSVSAGALGTALLLYLYPLRLKAAKLVGTDIVHAIPLTIVAGTGHMLMGNVNFALLGNLLVGSIPGIIIGSLLAAWAQGGDRPHRDRDPAGRGRRAAADDLSRDAPGPKRSGR